MRGDVPTPHDSIHVEMTKRRVIIEATGCGPGTFVVGNKRVAVEPGRRITVYCPKFY